jgi:hypothetical protein
MTSRTTARFWGCYRKLPEEIRSLARKNYALWRDDESVERVASYLFIAPWKRNWGQGNAQLRSFREQAIQRPTASVLSYLNDRLHPIAERRPPEP